jgi:hypothetical protein
MTDENKRRKVFQDQWIEKNCFEEFCLLGYNAAKPTESQPTIRHHTFHVTEIFVTSNVRTLNLKTYYFAENEGTITCMICKQSVSLPKE